MRHLRVCCGIAMAFGLLGVLNYHFAFGTRAYIDRQGRVVDLGLPVYLWTLAIWPCYALGVSGVLCWLLKPSLRAWWRVAACVLVAYCCTHVVAALLHGVVGLTFRPFYGLLAAQGGGENEKWPAQLVEMFVTLAIPLVVILGFSVCNSLRLKKPQAANAGGR